MINRLLSAGAAAAFLSSMSVGGVSPIANVAASVSSLFAPSSAYSSPAGGGGIFAALVAGAHHFAGGSDGTDISRATVEGSYRPPGFNNGSFHH